MLALERQRRILDLIREEGSARVVNLAERFKVTEETIRRDLDKLEEDGNIRRSHGGAVPNTLEIPRSLREIQNKREKYAIAVEALKRIQPGNTILLDASTTGEYIARELTAMPLTVVTNSLRAAEALAQKDGVEVILVGGAVSSNSLSCVGSEADQMLARYHVDSLFMSCAAVDVEKGIFEATTQGAALRRTMLHSADTCHLLVDHSKIGVRSLALVAPLTECDVFITDAGTSDADCDQLASIGLEVVRAP